jgi:NADPH:quinone reductase-like Zn-dependent oxidoreductase
MTTYTVTLSAAEDKALGVAALSQNDWIQGRSWRCLMSKVAIQGAATGTGVFTSSLARNKYRPNIGVA